MLNVELFSAKACDCELVNCELYHELIGDDSQLPLRVGCSKFRYKSDIKSARIQLVKLLTFNTLHCEIIL